MSVPTKPAYIHTGDFDSETATHPVFKVLQDYRDDYDARTFDLKWYAADYTYVAPDGQTYHGPEQAMAALKALYGPLTAHCHEPYYITCTETDYGLDMIGLATLWVDLPGDPAVGESKKTDSKGKKWDMANKGCFHFQWDLRANQPVLKRTEIMADTGPLVLALVKRGVLTPSDIGL